MFRAYVTVTSRVSGLVYWNKVYRALDGESTDLVNLSKQLQLTKDDVNTYVANKEKIALRLLDIKIEF